MPNKDFLQAMGGKPFNASDYEPLDQNITPDMIYSASSSNQSPELAFLDVLAKFGMEVNGFIEEGIIQRFLMLDADKSKGKSGWACFFGVDPFTRAAAGIYGDWREGYVQHFWSTRSESSMTEEQRAHYRRFMAERKAHYELERAKEREATAQEAWEKLNTLRPAINHEYLTKKQVSAYDVFVDKYGNLIIPIRNIKGEVRNLQTISASGKKLFMTGGEVEGCFHVIGDKFTKPTYIAEGYATAATVHKMTGKAVISAFTCGNLHNVIAAFREEFSHPLVIAADNDRFTKSPITNPGLVHADKCAAEFANVTVVCPVFRSNEKGTDFNDLFVDEGEEAVRAQLNINIHRQELEAPVFYPSEINPKEIPHRDWLYNNLLLNGYITTFVAAGGTGKSALSIVMAISVALGRPLIEGHTVKKARNVALLNNEDDRDELERRILGVCIHYGVDPKELKGKFHVRSGYDSPLMVATGGGDKEMRQTAICNELINYVIEHDIGLIIADPFVSLHDAPENDNSLQNEVIKVFRRICGIGKAAIMLVAHTRKGNGGDSESSAGDAESLRGASSIKDGARIAFTASRMSKQTAKQLRLTPGDSSRLIRIDDAKKNFSLNSSECEWLRMASVKLPNGDYVGVPEAVDLDDLEKSSVEGSGGKGKVAATTVAEYLEKYAGEDLLNRKCFMYREVKERLAIFCTTTLWVVILWYNLWY